MTAFLITFDPFTSNLEGVHRAITTANNVNEWWHFLSSAYIVTTNATLPNLTQSLKANGLTGGSYLIIEVKKNSGGSLPKQAWDWINSRIT